MSILNELQSLAAYITKEDYKRHLESIKEALAGSFVTDEDDDDKRRERNHAIFGDYVDSYIDYLPLTEQIGLLQNSFSPNAIFNVYGKIEPDDSIGGIVFDALQQDLGEWLGQYL